MQLFKSASELAQYRTDEEKETLVDSILKQVTVVPHKTVDFEFYLPPSPDYVVQNVRFGGPTRIRTKDQTVMSRPLYR